MVQSVMLGQKGQGIEVLWKGGRGSEKKCYVIYEHPPSVIKPLSLMNYNYLVSIPYLKQSAKEIGCFITIFEKIVDGRRKN